MFFKSAIPEFSIKEKFTLEERQAQSHYILSRHRDFRPIVLRSQDFPLEKNKYLVPADLPMRDFVFTLRKRHSIQPEQGIFILVANTMPIMEKTIGEMYQLYHDPDGFLYMTLVKESVFG